MGTLENPNFLKTKYDLHNALEVKAAAKNTKIRTGQEVPQNPKAQIQNYLDRLESLALDSNKEQSKKILNNESRPRALSLLREMVMNKYVRPNKEKMAEGAARVEERVAREMGIEAHYGEAELEQRGEIAVTDLEKSLDNWIMYLSDQNEPYPTWFRYYAFRNVLDMGDFDKDKGEFTKRSKGSSKLFPDIDRGALAFIEERIEAAKDPATLEKLRKAQQANQTPQDQLLTKEQAEAFAKMSFSKQYTEGIRQAGEITPEMRETTKGKWVKYKKGTDPTGLWASLQNKGTAWCTKGFATAETQLKGGDFYVYYTNNKTGQPKIPRIAIRMQGNNIGEVRGVADNQQNLEGNLVEIAEAKMNELPGAESYLKKSADMKQLTELENKIKQGQELNKNDLTFLYEIDSTIEGFGYECDPRIAQLRSQRNPEQDMLVIFECTTEQIAHNASEINENTKAYLGTWGVEVFQTIKQYPNIEYLYESFPDKKIFMTTLETDPQISSSVKAEEVIKQKSIYLPDWVKDTLDQTKFSKKMEQYHLVRFTVAQLGFPNGATTEQIYQKAKELVLELCPAEVGVHLRLQYSGKEFMPIAMKPIADCNGIPDVFCLRWNGVQLELRCNHARPIRKWDSGDKFVFRFRKLEP